jgi:hypothetical protein
MLRRHRVNFHRNAKWQWFICAAATFSFLFAASCNSRPSQDKREGKSATTAAAKPSTDPGIDLNCVIDHIQNPSEAFHYTYKKDTADDNLIQDADLTPDTIDGSSKNKYASRSLKGVKSDRDSWQAAWTGLTGISGMSSTIAIVNHSSATVREGAEKMNGYDAIRYSIDTARGNTAEAGLYRATLGDGGFEKGMAWVNAQGCPVKLSLDSEMHLKNGSVDKVHYEIEMVKK